MYFIPNCLTSLQSSPRQGPPCLFSSGLRASPVRLPPATPGPRQDMATKANQNSPLHVHVRQHRPPRHDQLPLNSLLHNSHRVNSCPTSARCCPTPSSCRLHTAYQPTAIGPPAAATRPRARAAVMSPRRTYGLPCWMASPAASGYRKRACWSWVRRPHHTA